ncbi:cilia- and flagella-associated protein 95-like [Babylonia areolata]|uniref:cilia- and flagella-associated protein 95-like n=1 Tax=Babylonia areolata TaxID=304850 RepID=UPI003FD313FF
MDDDFGLPKYENQKGSLTLRSDHTNYSRNVLNTDWQKAREDEPKEYDISKGPIRDLHWSTYKRLANITDGSIPETTYQEHFNQVFLEPYFSELDRVRPMVNGDTWRHAVLDRDTGDPKEGYLAVLPRYFPDYRKEYLKTRRYAGFDPFEPEKAVPRDFEDKSAAYRRCHSQFTDTADYRRPGWNTWQDESGIYANNHFKREAFPPRNPILRDLDC